MQYETWPLKLEWKRRGGGGEETLWNTCARKGSRVEERVEVEKQEEDQEKKKRRKRRAKAGARSFRLLAGRSSHRSLSLATLLFSCARRFSDRLKTS
jgi:hypothetical protein